MAAGWDEHEGSERKPWEQLPGEPDFWYGRFKLFLGLGPTRSVKQTYAKKSKAKDTSNGASRCWLEAANRWQWRTRADAWDLHQCNALAISEHNVKRAARTKRVTYLEEQLEEVREALRVADIGNCNQEQARKQLGVLSTAFEHLVEDLRKEFEKPLDEEAGDGPIITADDLRAAQREMERQEAEKRAYAPGGEEIGGEGEGANRTAQKRAGTLAEWNGGTMGRSTQTCRKRQARPKLVLCFGAAADDPFDLSVLRAGGHGHLRVREVVSSLFAATLRREHNFGRTVELLHMELPSSALGIVFANAQRDGAWLRRHLAGVRVLLLAHHDGATAAEWFDAVPNVVTIDEGLDAGVTRVFLTHFWQVVAQGRAASAALAQALAQCPEGTQASVRGYMVEAVEE